MELFRTPIIVKVKWLPFNYGGMTLWPWIFLRDEKLENHERIHIKQQEELLLIGFTILYLYYYIKYRIKGYSHTEAYRAVPFEREAYTKGTTDGMGYILFRKAYAWRDYIIS